MKTRFGHLKSSVSKLTRDFSNDNSGSLALMVGIAIIPMILVAGAAVDFYRVGSAKAEVQMSLDAGALAGAAAKPSATDAQRIKLAKDAFSANLDGGLGGQLVGEPDIKIENGRLVMSYDGALPTTLLRIGGFDKVNIGLKSSVNLRQAPRAEIAMVLDYSGSMGWSSAGQTKYITMRNAAIDMVNGLTENGTNKEVEFGLVPFSHNVYATLPSGFVKGATGGTWTGCTYDRQYPFNVSSNQPNGSNNSKWGQDAPTDWDGEPGQANYFCDGQNHNGNGYQANNLKIRELSSDHSAIVSQLQAMQPYGYTNISLGVEFGWHLLEPDAPYAARPFSDDKNKKFLVVLTDGKQTTPAFGSGGSRKISDGETNLTTLCGNIKNTDITVITIAFALNDAATETRLRNCSTDPDKHFFKAEDGNDLTSAFEEIQNQIASAIFLTE